MASRKEEERNEKIIRGLMKLPPNRRCINCNSLGPQYVCTNFWTFVCMTCSGIHREFTHRVKSVSMAKFTSQEVEALQNGGNQRARETYLSDWDSQRQRLPDSSNVDKVREFIKAVYVDRRYAGGKTSEKPPKNTQGLGSREDETRRASSYHSYSQSPPYDYQYEDRRYGKQHASLTRKPGSDRGYYVGKMSSIIYSPGRMSEQMFEDRFANEGSGSRVSDYSVSSGGDPFRSGAESPNFEKDIGFNSPPIQPSRDTSSSTANFKRDLEGIPRPQRTSSLGSMGSFDSNSMSLKSYNSGGFVDVTSEPEQAAGSRQDKMSTLPKSSSPVNYGGLDLFQPTVASESAQQDKMSTTPQSSGPVNYGGLDLFQPSVASESFSATPPIDLFQLPAASAAPVNVFQMPQATSTPSVNSYQPPQTSSLSSLDLFQISEQPSTITLDGKSLESSNPKNEGWATFDSPTPATFDTPPATSISGSESITPAIMPGNEGSSLKFNQFSSPDTSMQWPAFQNSSAQGVFPPSGLLFDDLHNVQTPVMATSTQSWNAFEDSTNHLPLEGVVQNSESQLAASKPLSTADQYLSFVVSEDSNHDGTPGAASQHGPPVPTLPSHVEIAPSYTPSVLPTMGETQAYANDLKSKNPFDFPYDSDLEQSNMFLDMSSLQAALPNAHLPSAFLGGANQSWFPQDPVTSFIPAAGQGGLAYMSGQVPSSQLPNVPAQEPVASVGGNPFA